MADTLSPEARSAAMRAVKSTDTSPELRVRSAAHRMGLRFRLHRKDLPGKPDLVFVSRRITLFVHGCFWHGHDCARGARVPKTNRAYWKAKIARNVERDARTAEALRTQGWRPATIWECEIKPGADIQTLLRARVLLDPPSPTDQRRKKRPRDCGNAS